MSLSNKESNIYDELTELEEDIRDKDLEIVILIQTINVLKFDAIDTVIAHQLEVEKLKFRRLH